MNRLFGIIMVGLWCFMATAVGSEARTSSQKPETAKSPQEGGVLAIALGSKPLHLNSAITSGIFTGTPATQIFAFLLRLDHNWEYQPYLAEKWEVSPDGLSAVFHLRPGVTFHDGKPLTSEDVAFSLLTIRKFHPFSDMLAAVEKVDTPDPLTAVVRLGKPHPALLTVLASPMTPILPKHVYGDGQDIRTHPANLRPVGSGPFRFVSFGDNEIVLEKHTGFFLPGRPYLDKLVFKIMPQPTTTIAMESETADLYGFTAEFKDILNNPGNNRIDFGGYEGIGGINWLAFNVRKPPLNDVRVRRAFAYAIDRDFLTKSLYAVKTKTATGPISPDSPFYSDNVSKYPVNTDLANKLLDEAGYPRNDKGFRFSLTIAPQTGMNHQIAEYVRFVVSRKLGVEIRILRFDKFGDWSKFVADGEFELATDGVFNWGDPVIGVHRTYSCRNIRPGVIWSNTQGYCNPVVDQLMDKAGTEMDIVRRKALYADFQKQVVEDLPVLWIHQLPYGTIRNRRLMGVENASVWGLMFPFTDVWWSKEEPKGAVR